MSDALSPIVPMLHYADLEAAVAWLPHVFGLELVDVVRGPDGTAQTAILRLGNGLIYARQQDDATGLSGGRLYVYVDDVDAHCQHVPSCGAACNDPSDRPWGDRLYDTHDLQGHPWTFTSKIAT